MKNLTRRDICSALPALAAIGVPDPLGAAQTSQPATQTPPAAAGPVLAVSQVFAFDAQPARATANGGESRNIVHGTLATGETVNLHQSMQVAGAAPPALHVIQHSELICVREGTLEFLHEDAAGKLIAETAGPGSVILVAFGTKHAIKNAGDGPARYFVVAIGGDAK
jgi:quercetin dioxygenase-like cupin family protein